MMDGYPVLIGDNVHDIVFGHGKIEILIKDQNKFWVRFGPNNLRCYATNGRGNFEERTLFWKNPITIVPHKFDDTWDKTIEVSEAVSKILASRK